MANKTELNAQLDFLEAALDEAGVEYAKVNRDQTNADLEKIVDTNDEWIVSRTGIKQRHILKEEGKIKLLSLKQISGTPRTLSTKHFIQATGTSKNTNSKLEGIGAGALFRNINCPIDEVSLFFVKGGHMGMNHFDKDLTNVCCIVNKKLFQKLDKSPEKIMQYFLDQHPGLARIFKNSTRETPFKGISLMKSSSYRFADKNGFLVGDAVGTIHPVVGGGNSIALASGSILAEQMLKYSPDNLPIQKVAQEYEKQWRKVFEKQMKNSWMWGKLCRVPFLTKAAITFFQWRRKSIQNLFAKHHQNVKFEFSTHY